MAGPCSASRDGTIKIYDVERGIDQEKAADNLAQDGGSLPQCDAKRYKMSPSCGAS